MNITVFKNMTESGFIDNYQPFGRTCFFHLLVTDSMLKSPTWKAHGPPASQEFRDILLNPNFHYHDHVNPPRFPILGQINVVHTHSSCSFKTYLNIILPSSTRSSKLSLPFTFFRRNLMCSSLLPRTSIFLYKIKSDWYFCYHYSGRSFMDLIFGF